MGLDFCFGEGVHHLVRWRHQALSWARLFLFIESARGLAKVACLAFAEGRSLRSGNCCM